jgi:hypothetical protein
METAMHVRTFASVIIASALICHSRQDANATAIADQADSPGLISVEQITRRIADQGQITPLSLKGTVKHEIGKNAPSYVLPTGQSRVAVFKLPDYRTPYALAINSLCRCLGIHKSIFVPSGTFFDAEFRPTHVLRETQFAAKAPGMKGYRLAAEIQVDGEYRDDRFLLLYTTADAVGTRYGTVSGVVAGASVVATIRVPVERAPEGTVEFEVRHTAGGG